MYICYIDERNKPDRRRRDAVITMSQARSYLARPSNFHPPRILRRSSLKEGKSLSVCVLWGFFPLGKHSEQSAFANARRFAKVTRSFFLFSLSALCVFMYVCMSGFVDLFYIGEMRETISGFGEGDRRSALI